mgnify:CR=1 FL=1
MGQKWANRPPNNRCRTTAYRENLCELRPPPSVEPDRYGNCEPRYAETLKAVTYHRNKNYLSYGVKLFPKYEDCGLNQQQLRMIEIWK